jgi:A/G-specific adenine glycosylase
MKRSISSAVGSIRQPRRGPGTVSSVTSPGQQLPVFRPEEIVTRTLTWYAEHARDLPWRRPGVTPWAVLVSEFMLQQTPVERVRGPWAAWLDRWPSPEALAAAPAGAAVRAWGRLGYPRRALRLHAAAVLIREQFGGRVPADHESLLSLPGVGSYTAAAVASFAYGRREVVLDTNVRRVVNRVVLGSAHPPAAASRLEVAVAERLAPLEPPRAARWAVASMELGALVCRARDPRCAECPVREECAWHLAGCPPSPGPPRRGQAYTGTDRQCRGALLAVLRRADEAVTADELGQVWPQSVQRDRALDSLVSDGLAVAVGDRWALPG